MGKPPSRAPGDTGPPWARLPGGKVPGRGRSSRHRTRDQRAVERICAQRSRWDDPRATLDVPSPSPHPALLCGPCSSCRPNDPRIANEEVRLKPLKFPPLPRLSPYRAPGKASNRCCLSVAFMRPRGSGSRERTPGRVSPGSCAPDAARRALACGESPTRLSRPPGAPLSRPLCRAGAAVGSSRCRSCCRTACARVPAPRAERFIRPSPTRVKRPAARRVQKPAGKGEGVAGCKGCPGAAPEHPSPCP